MSENKQLEEFTKVVETLIEVTVANVCDNAIATFSEMGNLDAQEKIAKNIISKVFVKSSKYAKDYFDNKRKNDKI